MNFDMLASVKACLAAIQRHHFKSGFFTGLGILGGGEDFFFLLKKKTPQNFDTESIANPGANDV